MQLMWAVFTPTNLINSNDLDMTSSQLSQGHSLMAGMQAAVLPQTLASCSHVAGDKA